MASRNRNDSNGPTLREHERSPPADAPVDEQTDDVIPDVAERDGGRQKLQPIRYPLRDAWRIARAWATGLNATKLLALAQVFTAGNPAFSGRARGDFTEQLQAARKDVLGRRLKDGRSVWHEPQALADFVSEMWPTFLGQCKTRLLPLVAIAVAMRQMWDLLRDVLGF